MLRLSSGAPETQSGRARLGKCLCILPFARRASACAAAEGRVARPLGMDAQRVLSSPAALFLFLFYLLVYLGYFSDRIQGSGYFTAIAPAHRTLTALLTNSTTELDPILEEAKEKWFSNDVLHALHPPLPPPTRMSTS